MGTRLVNGVAPGPHLHGPVESRDVSRPRCATATDPSRADGTAPSRAPAHGRPRSARSLVRMRPAGVLSTLEGVPPARQGHGGRGGAAAHHEATCRGNRPVPGAPRVIDLLRQETGHHDAPPFRRARSHPSALSGADVSGEPPRPWRSQPPATALDVSAGDPRLPSRSSGIALPAPVAQLLAAARDIEASGPLVVRTPPRAEGAVGSGRGRSSRCPPRSVADRATRQ